MPSPTLSRRRLLAVGGAAACSPFLSVARADRSQVQETFRLLAKVPGWEGQSPDAIAGTTNPTISLEPESDYAIVWENGDGAEHSLQIRTDSEETVASTESMATRGETHRLEFTATEEMAAYRCGIHTFSMRGDLSFGSETTTAVGTTSADGTEGTTSERTSTPTATLRSEPTPTPSSTATTATGGDTTTAVTGTSTTDDTSDGGGMPGFGPLAALVGGTGALALRRLTDGE